MPNRQGPPRPTLADDGANAAGPGEDQACGQHRAEELANRLLHGRWPHQACAGVRILLLYACLIFSTLKNNIFFFLLGLCKCKTRSGLLFLQFFQKPWRGQKNTAGDFFNRVKLFTIVYASFELKDKNLKKKMKKMLLGPKSI
jgi:hypothetical protein